MNIVEHKITKNGLICLFFLSLKKNFSKGLDLKEIYDIQKAKGKKILLKLESKDYSTNIHQLISKIHKLTIPTISVIHVWLF